MGGRLSPNVSLLQLMLAVAAAALHVLLVPSAAAALVVAPFPPTSARAPAHSPPRAPFPSTVLISPGIHMPLMNLGGVNTGTFKNGSGSSDYNQWLALGGRGIDTAFQYGDDVQEAVGSAVQHATSSGIATRAELFVTSKVPCCVGNTLSAGCRGKVANTSANVAHDLATLGLAHLDLLLLHWPCTTLADTVATYRQLQPLVHSGKARAIGVSNFVSCRCFRACCSCFCSLIWS